MPDGTLATSTYLAYFLPNVIPLLDTTESTQAAKLRLQTQVNGLTGSTIYPTYGAKVYSNNSTMTQLAHGEGAFSPTFFSSIKVVSGKVIDFEGYTYGVLKVASEEGATYLTCTRVSLDSKVSVLGADTHFLASLAGYSATDVAAVRTYYPQIGMSRTALGDMWGYDYQDNDYGNGGHQLVYNRSGNQVIVYLSSRGFVTDVQSFPSN